MKTRRDSQFSFKVVYSQMNDVIYFVFKPKGADRKQKTDREKMEKRTAHEKEKYQPSYDTTILTEVMQLSIRLWKQGGLRVSRTLQKCCNIRIGKAGWWIDLIFWGFCGHMSYLSLGILWVNLPGWDLEWRCWNPNEVSDLNTLQLTRDLSGGPECPIFVTAGVLHFL